MRPPFGRQIWLPMNLQESLANGQVPEGTGHILGSSVSPLLPCHCWTLL